MSKHRHYDIGKGRKWKTLVFGHALCFRRGGGVRGGTGSWLLCSRWSCTHSLKVSDPEAVEAGVGGRDR